MALVKNNKPKLWYNQKKEDFRFKIWCNCPTSPNWSVLHSDKWSRTKLCLNPSFLKKCISQPNQTEAFYINIKFTKNWSKLLCELSKFLLAEEPPLWKIAARHFWLADHWLCSLDLIILDEREWFQTGFGGKLYFVVPVISRRNCTARIITNPIQVWSVQPQQKRKTLSYFRWQDASLIEQHCYMDAEKICLDQEGAEKKLRWWIGIF